MTSQESCIYELIYEQTINDERNQRYGFEYINLWMIMIQWFEKEHQNN